MNNEYTTIYIARHGETESNRSRVIQGHGESNLTEEGEKQAMALGDKLRYVKFDKVFSSDLSRAKRTAELVVLDKALAINTTELLRERFWGKYEGRRRSEFTDENMHLLEKFEALSDDEKWNFKYDTDARIESSAEVYNRAIVLLREIGATYLGKNVLVVCHGGVVRALLIAFGWGGHKELVSGAVGNTAYMKVRSDGVDFFVDEVVGVTKNTDSSEGG